MQEPDTRDDTMRPEDALVARIKVLKRVAQESLAQHDFANALQTYSAALELDPTNAEILLLAGNLYKHLNKPDTARQLYLTAKQHHPELVEPVFNLATLAQDSGNYRDAISTYQQVLRAQPRVMKAWSNLAAALTYEISTPQGSVCRTLQGFNEAFTSRPMVEARQGLANKPRLRIGYVSPDFRAHPVGYLMLPLIQGHNRKHVEVYCYFVQTVRDAWTEEFKTASDVWIDAAAMNDEALARKIKDDGIDILVDLAGHSKGNRLVTCMAKPAPITVTWFGYVTTTGSRNIDWRLTNADADPHGAEAEYTERLYRLPGALWCFRPLPDMPEIKPAPMLQNGFITFGVLNRYSKNSASALTAWASILRAVPLARLKMNAPEGESRQRVRRIFEQQGVEPDRITFMSHGDHAYFWRELENIDIALDPFPFGGGMTTLETLWLGVPVVTCCGGDLYLEGYSFASRFASRMCRAILKSAGLEELAAATVPDYIAKAVALAGSPQILSRLRNDMRSKMKSSPLMDEETYVRQVEVAYADMWAEFATRESTHK